MDVHDQPHARAALRPGSLWLGDCANSRIGVDAVKTNIYIYIYASSECLSPITQPIA
jgi:hypothetical protein